MKTKKYIISFAAGISTIAASSAIISCSSNVNVTGDNNKGNEKNASSKKDDKTLNNTDKIRVGSWNIANFNVSGNYFKSRVNRLSKIINNAKLDLLGVQEIDSLAAIYKLAKELNYINKTANEWKVVASDWAWKAKKTKTTDPEYMGSISAREYYGFIYKSSKVKPKAFTDGKIGDFYDNPWKENEFLKKYNDNNANTKKIPNILSSYVRPPFGVMFDVVGKEKDFTLITSHFDSPGVSGAKTNEFKNKNKFTTFSKDTNIKNKGETSKDTFELNSSSGNILGKFYSGAGSQEIFEAQNLKYVFDYFKAKSGTNKDLIFVGDTNIKALKSGKLNPFQSTIDAGYTEAFDSTSEESKTTLGKSGYASPYDRFYYKDDEVIEKSAKKFPLTSVYNISKFTAPILDPSEKAVAGKTIDNNLIKKLTSDHTLVYLDINTSKKDNDISSTNVVDQSSREIDVNKASFWDLLTKAGIDKKLVHKILYYRNLVGKITKTEMENLVKYIDYNKNLTGSLTWLENINNIKFTYGSTPTKKSKENYFEETSYKTLIPKELKIEKIDINKTNIELLDELKNKGLIDEGGYKRIIDKRDAKTKITNLADIGLNQSHLKKLYDKLFDFSSNPTALPANPYKINVSNIKSMIDSLTGSKTKPLYTYSVYAIAAHRILVGPISTKEELEAIIGEYGTSKISSRVNFDHNKPVDNSGDPVASLLLSKKAKININDAPNTIIEKIFGSKTAEDIIANLENIKNKQIKESNEKPGENITIDGAKNFNGIKGSYKPEYYKSAFEQIFTFSPVVVTVPTKTTTNPQTKTFNIANLISYAKGGGGIKIFLDNLEQYGIIYKDSKGHRIIGDTKGTKSKKMSRTQTEYVYKALNKASPANVKNYTDLVAALQAVKKYAKGSVKKYEVFKNLLPKVEQA